MSDSLTTRAGCRITVERVGASVGVTIHPAGDKPRLYACGADEAAAVAALIAPEAAREAEERVARYVLEAMVIAAAPVSEETVRATVRDARERGRKP